MTTIPAEARERIEDALRELEAERDVSVVLAVARGSHAWGLDSPESDYDVGVVYAPRDLRTGFHLSKPRDTVERTFGADIELSGWGVTKFATLLSQSNDGAIDALRSPIRYRERFDADTLREYVEATFDPVSLYYCYRGIAKSNYRKYLSWHLVDSEKQLYPIVERTDEAYVVRSRGSDGEFTIPRHLVDSEEPARIPAEHVESKSASGAERPSHEFVERTVRSTKTRQTVKRNLAVLVAVMSARYLLATGEEGRHELPHVDVPTFLAEQAPDVFDDDLLALAEELVERKRRGDDGEIGDRIGPETATLPEKIDYETHARPGPDASKLDEFVDEMLDAAAEP
ncbi:DNA polymerase beta superfamily protein [Haloprofundus sp. MHR1]|uniref:nucleotidyltransferase domain-containing protein n=1 Tax=Haloprofundus sp. MHR1 TaxID=2572921 RepID=UPI0010BF55A3|nr:nucleotidyltransferase domain-containing protein [Haloprofundus sp. MHR1]QCJ46463.1 nucleotidyltransferase [Haloprofundus sp. MHR1]